MDAEERPQKIRKLSHDADDPSIVNLASDSANHAETNNDVIKQVPEAVENTSNVENTEGSDLNTGSLSEPSKNEAEGSKPSAPTNGTAAPLSKNQLKKQRRRDEWEAKREDRKVKRKERVVRQRERKREERESLVAQGLPLPEPTKKPRSVTLPITILFDCNFDEFMRDNERVSLSAQITRAYSDNRNARYRAHLAVNSFGGSLKDRFDNVLGKHYESWKGTRFLPEDFVAVSKQAQEWMRNPQEGGKLAGPCFEKYAADEDSIAKCKEEGETIYLSSDSDTTLTELKPYTTYIIGGLVDKNREKGLCHRRAVEAGVKTARLPIGDFLDMTSRKVLTTNHVNEIMLRWLECGDWGEAFMKVIPKRKGGQLKGKNGGGDEEEEEDGAEDHDDGENAEPLQAAAAEAVDCTATEEPKPSG
ncbi:hypothetical protein MBLNU457_1484t1 [Dothideomycetes sp. NU457]